MGLLSQGFRASLGKCSYTLVSEDKADMQSSLEEQRKRQKKSPVPHPLFREGASERLSHSLFKELLLRLSDHYAGAKG